MFWCEKENRWCSVWSCDRRECEFVVRASDKEIHHFGNTVFLIKSKAEAELKEYLRGGENG